MSTRPLMKCGCVALGVDMDTRLPVCPVHAGLTPDAERIEDNPPDLTGREAVCCYCECRKPSSLDLPFFEYRANRETDSYYNGCRGWD